MLTRLLRYWAMTLDLLMFALMLAAPVQAQDTIQNHNAERLQRMEEHRPL